MGPINKPDTLEINRGVELLLRKRREKKILETEQKKFGFLKKISLFGREIQINFFISLTEKR